MVAGMILQLNYKFNVADCEVLKKIEVNKIFLKRHQARYSKVPFRSTVPGIK